MTDSPIVTAFFDMSGLKVATPVLNPNGGTFPSSRLVSLSCATAGATIMYTRDGSNPSATNGLSYNPIASPSGITIDKTCTLKVIAVKSGMSASDIVSAYFVISGSTSTKVAIPVITPGSGTYSSAKSISLSCSTSGATIKYTTNDDTPSPTKGNTYTGAFTVSSTTTVKAMAYKSGMTNSDVASAIITISSSSGAFSITLRPNSTSSTLGKVIELNRVGLIVNYSNGTRMETGAWKGIIPPPESSLPARGMGSWSKISGSGSFTTDSFNGYIYKPSAKGTHVLKFSYTEGGVTKTADFTISVN